MGKSIKETLLGTLVHGEEILNEIQVLRKVSQDQLTVEDQAEAVVRRLHPGLLDLVVTEIIDTGRNAKVFRLASTDGCLPPFEAGQYLNIFVEIDNIRTSRPYSISSSPRQRAYYEITVARTANGFVSDYMLDRVQVGARFQASCPSGVFHYQPVFHRKKMLLLGGGSGVTPFLSMIREVTQAGLDRDIVLIYGARTAETALFYEEMKHMNDSFPNFRYHLVVSDADAVWDGPRGFITDELIRTLVPDYAQRTCYICGPEVMNAFCVEQLQHLGVDHKHIRREMFGAAKDITKEPGWPKDLTGRETFKVTVNGDKVIEARANEPLLIALERAGVRVNVCCRSGECSLCRIQLVSGKVFLSKGMMLRKADEKYGYIHSCNSYPMSDLEILL